MDGTPSAGGRCPAADLRKTHLIGANLIGANLSGADLSGANLSGARMREPETVLAGLAGGPAPTTAAGGGVPAGLKNGARVLALDGATWRTGTIDDDSFLRKSANDATKRWDRGGSTSGYIKAKYLVLLG